MGVILQVGDQEFAAEALMPLLVRHQLLPQLVREIIIDQAIADIDCPAEAAEKARQKFYAQQKITSEQELKAWLKQKNMPPAQLEQLIVRPLKLNQFMQDTWGKQLGSYFLQRKQQLDQVIYSLIRTQDIAIAQELYFRLQGGEASFSELAQQYSKGSEAQTGGLIGPVELSTPHPKLAKVLSMGEPGQVWPPTQIGNWIVIVRLEQLLPAQLDQSMQQRLLNELFNTWLQEQFQTQVTIPAPSAPSSSGDHDVHEN